MLWGGSYRTSEGNTLQSTSQHTVTLSTETVLLQHQHTCTQFFVLHTFPNTPAHSHSSSQTLLHSHSLVLTLTPSHTPLHSLTHTHSLTLTLTFALTLSHSLALCSCSSMLRPPDPCSVRQQLKLVNCYRLFRRHVSLWIDERVTRFKQGMWKAVNAAEVCGYG